MSNIVGQRIVKVRQTTLMETWSMGWENSGVVLELEDGTLLLPTTTTSKEHAEPAPIAVATHPKGCTHLTISETLS